LYFVTGNSDFSGTTYNTTYNLSESVVKISSDLTKVINHFTPSNVAHLDMIDADLGSGGVLLIPSPVEAGTLFLATVAGEIGPMFLLNQRNLKGGRWGRFR
jgi:hypothetical protein